MANEGEVAAALMRAYAAITPSLEDTGKKVVRELKAATSIPYPPASQAGMPPHRRSGEYQGHFKSYVHARQLSIYNDARTFDWLEEGTSKMRARPVLPIARNLLAAYVPKNLSTAIQRAERKRR